MKKTLIALAAVAAASASFAQSTVTLSGTLDTGLEKRFSGDPMRMTSNRNGTSNWTLSGAEDLGGGLKAVFQVSTAFNVDDGTVTGVSTGTSGTALGNNGMFVGLTGGFGTLRAGRPVNTLYGNAMFANGTKGVSLHDSNTVLSGLVANAGNSVYVNNAVQYHSPRFAGFQVQVEYAPSEVAGGDAGTGIAVRYDGGPLSASVTNYTGAGTVAYAPPLVTTAIAANLSPKSVTQLAAAYDFGVAKLFFTYRDQSGVASNADTGYALGVTAPVGPGSLYASYNVREQAPTAATPSDGRTIIAGYKYLLSKRTQAYVNVARRNASWQNNAVVAAGGKANSSSTGFGIGLQHNF
jgi:predicted porin